MHETPAAAQDRYRKFINRVVETGEVWVLRGPSSSPPPENDGPVAVTESNERKRQLVMLFWSAKAYAHRCVLEDWEDYLPDMVPLAEFLERWLPGMHQDKLLAGIEWNAQLRGLELFPKEVLADFESVMGETEPVTPMTPSPSPTPTPLTPQPPTPPGMAP